MVMQVTAGRARTYGALELKQSYQHNLSLAMLLAGALHALIIGGALWYGQLTEPETVIRPVDSEGRTVILEAESLPDIVREQPQALPGAPGAVMGQTGIPVAIPDELVTDDIVIATRRELHDFVSAGNGGGGKGAPGTGPGIAVPIDIEIPPMNTFVPLESQPVAVRQILPEYPTEAAENGLTARLIVRAFVGADGHVLKAAVVQCSAKKLGFEEAALAAVLRWEFRPAIQNGQPVGTWLSVPIVFALK